MSPVVALTTRVPRFSALMVPEPVAKVPVPRGLTNRLRLAASATMVPRLTMEVLLPPPAQRL